MSDELARRERAHFAAPCTLRKACSSRGYDEDGRRCADCPVRHLCENDDRWLVQLTPYPGGPK